ncbi:MAG: HlyD family efflux transporter periplasmic adaptor subunit [Planctomycetota bacterium]
MLQSPKTVKDFEPPIAMPTLRLAATPSWLRRVSRLLLILFIASPFFLTLVPWMQTAGGKGRVVANSPLERQQELRAPLDGIIVDFYGHVEGSVVRKGDPVFRIADNDPLLAQRLESQIGELQRKIDYSLQKDDAFDNQMNLLNIALNSAIESAQANVETAENKVTAFERSVDSGKGPDAARQIYELAEATRVRMLGFKTGGEELADRDQEGRGGGCQADTGGPEGGSERLQGKGRRPRTENGERGKRKSKKLDRSESKLPRS